MMTPIPEDLDMLLRKATRLSTHLEKNKTDLVNKRALQVIEARIHKLSKYYKRQGTIPTDWKYQPRAASMI
jgi:small subunit ribosomal protein S15